MSEYVDERVVKMEFNNENFEKNIKTSMNTLDQFENKLDLSMAAESLSKSIDKISTNVEMLSGRFSVMGVAGMAAIANIVNSAMDAGEKLVKSLTIDNISSGFKKYEQELKSVQTIMAATNLPIESVEEQLEKLSWYADETSYSYDAMVTSVGKFTSQGIALDDAVSQMQGLANIAGLAGAEASQAVHMFEGMAKAMATGYMSNQVWKTWVSTAKVDTMATKEIFLDAAEAEGTLIKISDDLYETLEGHQFTKASFAEQLKDQWLNADVMQRAYAQMNEYSDLVYEFQSNYTDLTGKIITCSKAMDILGDSTDVSDEKIQSYIKSQEALTGRTLTTEEALSELSKITGSLSEKAFRAAQEYRTFSDAINTVKEGASSAWRTIFKDIFGNAEEAKAVWTELGDTLYEQFVEPLWSIEEVVGGWRDAGGTDELIEALFSLLNTVIKIKDQIKEAFGNIFDSFTSESLNKASSAIKNVADIFDSFIEGKSDKIISGFEGIFSIIKYVKDAFSSLFFGIKPVFNILGSIISYSVDVFGIIGKGVKTLTEVISSLKVFEILGKTINTILGSIAMAIEWILNTVGAANEGVSNFLGGVFENGWPGVKKVLNEASNKILDFIPTAEQVRDGFLKAVSAIKNAFSSLPDGVKTPFTKIKSFCTDLKNFIVSTFNKIQNGAGKSLTSLGSKISTTLDPIKKSLSEFFESLNFEKIINGLSKAVDVVIKIGKTLWNGLKNIVTEVLSLFDGGSINGVLKAANTGIFTLLLLDIKKGLKEGNLLKKAASILDAVKNLINSYAEGIKYDKLKSVSTSIAILAASILVLSSIDTGRMGKATAAIAALFAVLTGFLKLTSSAYAAKGTNSLEIFAGGLKNGIKSISDIQSAVNFSTMASGLLKMSAAIFVLSGAIKLLSTIEDSSTLWESVAVATTIIAFVGLYNMAMSKIESENFSIKSSVSLLGIAAVILSVAKALKMISDIKINDGVIASIIAMLAAMVISFKGLSSIIKASSGGGDAKVWLSLLSTCAMLLVIVKVLAKLSETKLNDGVLLSLISVLLTIAFSLSVLAKATENGGKASGILSMCAALITIAAALKIISGIDSKDIFAYAKVLGGALLAISAALWLLDGTVSAKDTAKAFTEMSVGLLAIAAAFLVIGQLNIDQLTIGLIGLGGALAVFLISAVAIQYLALGPALILLGESFKSFGIGLLSASAAILLITAALAVLTAIAPAFLVAAGAIGAGLAILLIELAAAAVPIALALGEAFKAFAPSLIEGIHRIVQGALTALKEDIPLMVETLITIVMTALEMLAASAEPIGKYLTDILMKLVIGAIEGLVANLEKMSSVLVDFFTGLVDFVFNIISEVSLVDIAAATAMMVALSVFMVSVNAFAVTAVAAMALMNVLALEIDLFADNIVPPLEKLKSIDPSVAETAKYIGDFVLSLSAAAILDAINIFSGGSYLKFALILKEFGPLIAEYAESVRGIDSESVLASTQAGLMLAELSNNLPTSGGLFSWIKGDTDMTAFSASIVAFGNAIAEYSKVVSGKIDSEAVTASANAGLALAELEDNLPGHGDSVKSWFGGDNDLASFAEGLVPFGQALVDYSSIVGGKIDADAVISSAEAAVSLAELERKLPNHGPSVRTWFGGDSDLATFAEGLTPMARALVDYSNIISKGKLEYAGMKASLSVVEAFIELADIVPDDGTGVFDKIKSLFSGGESSLADYIKGQMVPFAGAMIEYSDALKAGKFTDSYINRSITAVSAMADILSTYDSLGSLNSLAKQDWSAIKVAIDGIADAIISYTRKFNYVSINTKLINDSIEAVTALSDILSSLPRDGSKLDSFFGSINVETFKTNVGTLAESITEYSKKISGFDESSVSKSTEALTVINDLMQALPKDESGSFKSKIFGNTDMSLFGAQLVSFGESVVSYSKTVSGIEDYSAMNSATAAMNSIVNMLKDFDSAGSLFEKLRSSSPLKTLGTQLLNLGEDLIKYSEDCVEVNTTEIMLMNKLIKDIFESISEAVNNNQDAVKKFEEVLSTLASESISAYSDTFQSATIQETVFASAKSFLDAVGKKIAEYKIDARKKFIEAGQYCAQGFANCISQYTYKSEAKAKAMADAAYKAAKKALEIHSPSKKFAWVGDMAVKGFINPFAEGVNKAYQAGDSMGESAADGLKTAIQTALGLLNGSDIDNDFVIRPTLDLSSLRKDVSSLKGMVESGRYGVTVNGEGEATSNGSTVSFIQNNYSPKALSRYDIYRQTRNQLAMLRVDRQV